MHNIRDRTFLFSLVQVSFKMVHLLYGYFVSADTKIITHYLFKYGVIRVEYYDVLVEVVIFVKFILTIQFE